MKEKEISLKNPKIKTVMEYVANNLGLRKKRGEGLEDAFREYTEKPYSIKVDKVISTMMAFKESKIKIVGDYDVDGVTSVNELILVLEDLGFKNFSARFPDRESEGYGISPKITDEILADPEIKLVILLDNGIVAVEEVARLRKAKKTVIIIDHHLVRDDGMIPNAHVILNPHVFPGQSQFKEYCTAGLVYKIAEKLDLSESVFEKIKGFAAIGTVCDMVTMKGDNRRIVTQGLESLKKDAGRTVGLRALLEKQYLLYNITEKDIGFKVGPCINSWGRIRSHGADFISKALLLDADPLKEDPNVFATVSLAALENAKMTIDLNNKRKEMVATALPLCDEAASKEPGFIKNIYVKGIAEGIVGILAGDISKKYKCVANIFSDSKDKAILKGSGRAYMNKIHLKYTLDKVSEYIYKYGGHEGAAGISVKRDGFELFKQKIAELPENSFPEIVEEKETCDFIIDSSEILSMAKELKRLAPFGQENEDPMFLIKNFKAVKIEFFEKNAKVVKFTDEYGNEAIDFLNADMFRDYETVTLNVCSQIAYESRGKREYGKIIFTDSEILSFSYNKEYYKKLEENNKKEEAAPEITFRQPTNYSERAKSINSLLDSLKM